MTNVSKSGVLKRAKENCERAGLKWEPSVTRVTGDHRPKTGDVLDEFARQSYLKEAHRQLLEEAARDDNG